VLVVPGPDVGVGGAGAVVAVVAGGVVDGGADTACAAPSGAFSADAETAAAVVGTETVAAPVEAPVGAGVVT
jgi:hypothetical protein